MDCARNRMTHHPFARTSGNQITQQKGDFIFIHEAESITTREAYLSEDFTDDLVLTSTEEYHIPTFGASFCFSGRELISREELEGWDFGPSASYMIFHAGPPVP